MVKRGGVISRGVDGETAVINNDQDCSQDAVEEGEGTALGGTPSQLFFLVQSFKMRDKEFAEGGLGAND